MAKSRIVTFLKRASTSRAKPNTIMTGLGKGDRMYKNGGKVKTQPKKKSS